MGRAARANAETRATTAVGDRIIRRGKAFTFRGRIVGYELHPDVILPSTPNPPPEPLQDFELREDDGMGGWDGK